MSEVLRLAHTMHLALKTVLLGVSCLKLEIQPLSVTVVAELTPSVSSRHSTPHYGSRNLTTAEYWSDNAAYRVIYTESEDAAEVHQTRALPCRHQRQLR